MAVLVSASAVFATVLYDAMKFFTNTFFSPPHVFILPMPTEVELTVCPTLLVLVQIIASWIEREWDAAFIT